MINPYFPSALKVTSTFEGSDYASVAGDFDGQGISVGLMQWNYGQGTLQSEILKPFIETYGADFFKENFFKGLHTDVIESAYMAPHNAIEFSRKFMVDDFGLKTHWAAAWSEFMGSKECVKIQNNACVPMWSEAGEICNENELGTKKAHIFMFDVVVQNGSMKGINKPPGDIRTYLKNLEEYGQDGWSEIGLNDLETRILYNWICLRANKNMWRKDVLARKGSIAHGKGRVHGQDFNFRF